MKPKPAPYKTQLIEPSTWFASLSIGGKIWAGIAGALAIWTVISPLLYYSAFHQREHVAILTPAGISHAELEGLVSSHGMEEAARLFVVSMFERGPGGVDHPKTLAALCERSALNKVIQWQASRNEEFREGQLYELPRISGHIRLLGQGPMGAQVEITGEIIRYGVSPEGMKFHPDPIPFELHLFVAPSLDLLRANRWPYQVRALLLKIDNKIALQ